MTTPLWKIVALTALGGGAVGGAVYMVGPRTDALAVGAPEPAAAPAPAAAPEPVPQAEERAAADVVETAPAQEEAQADAEEAPDNPPAFDVVRIEPDGSAVIAGQAAPGSSVALMLGDEEIARAQADGSGRFVALLSLAPSDQPRMLSLLADPSGSALRSDETVIVSPFAAPQVDVAEAPEPEPTLDVPAETAAVETAALDTEPEMAPEELAAEPAPEIRLEADLEPAEDILEEVPPTAELALPDVATPSETVSENADRDEADRLEVAGVAAAQVADAPEIADGADTAEVAPAVTPTQSEPQQLAAADSAPEPADPAPQPAEIAPQPAEIETEPAVPDVAPPIASSAPTLPSPPAIEAGASELASAELDQPEPEGPRLALALSAAEPADPGTTPAPAAPVSAELTAPSLSEPPATSDDGAATLAAPGALAVPDSAAPLLAPLGPETGPAPDAASAPAPVAPDVPAGLAEVGSGVPAPQPSAPSVFVADSTGVRILQPAGGEAAPAVMSSVALDSITYDEGGEVIVGGRGNAESFVRIYLNNEPVKVSRIAEDGQWRTDLPEVDTGVYTLRVDEVSASGEVLSRIETPFRRESPEILAQVMAEETSRAGFNVAVKTVQPGHTLWAIAEERYGEGILYVRVFEANRDLIRDPNMIFPGQVFRLPEDTQDG